MFVRDKILYELDRTASILIVSALKNIFERLFSEVGIIGLSYYRFLQFAGVIRQCELRTWISSSTSQIVAEAFMNCLKLQPS